MSDTRDTHPERWIEEQLPRQAEPDPSWPQWAVELKTRWGTYAGEHCEIAAALPQDAIAAVDGMLAGTGLCATDNVWPASLHPDHPRYAATEAARKARS